MNLPDSRAFHVPAPDEYLPESSGAACIAGQYRGRQPPRQMRVHVVAVDRRPRGRRQAGILPRQRTAWAVDVVEHPEAQVRRVRLDVRQAQGRAARADTQAGAQVVGAVGAVRGALIER